MEKEMKELLKLIEGNPQSEKIMQLFVEVGSKTSGNGIESNGIQKEDTVYLYANKMVTTSDEVHYDPVTDIEVNHECENINFYMYADNDLLRLQNDYEGKVQNIRSCGYDIVIMELSQEVFVELSEKLIELQSVVIEGAKSMTSTYQAVRDYMKKNTTEGELFEILVRNVETLLMGVETLGQGVAFNNNNPSIINIGDYDYINQSEDEEDNENYYFDEDEMENDDENDDEDLSAIIIAGIGNHITDLE